MHQPLIHNLDLSAIAVVTKIDKRWSLMSKRLGIHGMPCHSVEYAIEACVVALLKRGWR